MPETFSDLMPETPDLNQERLAQLKAVLPDIFTDEGKLDEKQLKQILEFAQGEDKPLHAPETYEFNWFGKAKAKEQAFTPTRLTLQYDADRSFNAEHSENVIIEGENLEVLKLLLCGYRGAIKCIYIDPPYNTGKDFVYSDKHATEYREYLEKTGKMRDGIKTDANADTSGRYHSDWLSMMFSRLIVAQQLLKKDGVIFISIDDNEVHNLRKLCDDVFGADNFIANIIWQKKYSPQNDAKYFSAMHDHILCFAKNRDDETGWKRNLLERTEEQNARYTNRDNDPRGVWKSADFSVKTYSADYDYPIKTPSGKIVNPPRGRCWQTSQENYLRLHDENRIWFGKNGDSMPSLKMFLTDVKAGIVPSTIFFRHEVGDNEEAMKELKKMFGGSPFDTPKPTRLLKRILEISVDDGDTVLDFFGGSGAFGQAVLEFQKEREKHLSYLLVQLPEQTNEQSQAKSLGYDLISDVTIARNKNVARELSTNNKKLGFKVFTLEKSYFPRTEWTPEPGMDEAAKLASLRAYIAEKEGQQTLAYDHDKLLTEVLIKEGFKLTYKAVQRQDFTENIVYNVTDGEREAVVCLDPSLADSTVKQLRQLIDKKVVVIERALDTTKKWNLHNDLGERFKAF